MKRLIFMALAAVLFTACSDDDYVTEENYYYPDSFTKNYFVTADMWTPQNDADFGVYYTYNVQVKELTHDVFDDGIMAGYLFYKLNNGKVDTLTPLPFTDYWLDEDGYKWEEQVTVEFSPGWVTFILKADEQDPTIKPYYDYEFQIKLLW